jgi:hypothetical protein
VRGEQNFFLFFLDFFDCRALLLSLESIFGESGLLNSLRVLVQWVQLMGPVDLW